MDLDKYFEESTNTEKYIVESSCCVGCGRCKMSCPEKAIQKIEGLAVINQEICGSCGVCMEVCPHGAIRKI